VLRHPSPTFLAQTTTPSVTLPSPTSSSARRRAYCSSTCVSLSLSAPAPGVPSSAARVPNEAPAQRKAGRARSRGATTVPCQSVAWLSFLNIEYAVSVKKAGSLGAPSDVLDCESAEARTASRSRAQTRGARHRIDRPGLHSHRLDDATTGGHLWRVGSQPVSRCISRTGI
jgi:hypothetical protein